MVIGGKGLVASSEHLVLCGGSVGIEKLIEQAANKLVEVFLQGSHIWLSFVFELIVLQVDRSLLQLFLFSLHVLLVVQLNDLFIKTADALLINAVVSL